MSHTSNPVRSVQGTKQHILITQLINTCATINIRCHAFAPNAVVIGSFPNQVDVHAEHLEDGERIIELFRVRIWKTKEIFHVVANGPGQLLLKLSLRGVPLYEY